jgi:hypothetical protein
VKTFCPSWSSSTVFVSLEKSGTDIFEAFEHAYEAVCAEGCDEARLRLVLMFHVYLVVPQKTVYQQHDFASSCRVNDFVDSGKREVIFGENFVEASEVYAHSLVVVFFFTMTILAS